MSIEMSRRGLIASSVITAAGATASASAAPVYDPRATAEGQVKLAATLDGSPAFWVYTGVIYAVRPKARPLAILALSGCQSNWAHRRKDGSFVVGGAIVTFFRDPVTGRFIDSFDNPFTSARNAVKPNILSGGGVLYPADGSSARAFGQIKNAVIAPGGFGKSDPDRLLGAVRWNILGGKVMLMTDRSWNVPIEPQLEAQTQIAGAADFFNPAITKLPASFSATTIMPWMTWLEMADLPGHLAWHSSGEKIFSTAAIPADYKSRAGTLMETLISPPVF